VRIKYEYIWRHAGDTVHIKDTNNKQTNRQSDKVTATPRGCGRAVGTVMPWSPWMMEDATGLLLSSCICASRCLAAMAAAVPTVMDALGPARVD
jgi:hypothetical protein